MGVIGSVIDHFNDSTAAADLREALGGVLWADYVPEKTATPYACVTDDGTKIFAEYKDGNRLLVSQVSLTVWCSTREEAETISTIADQAYINQTLESLSGFVSCDFEQSQIVFDIEAQNYKCELQISIRWSRGAV
jgi:hypothetical protein